MKYTIGIDVGKKGGITVLETSTGKILKKQVMPLLEDGDVDGNALLSLLADYSEECHCIIEKLHAMPLFGAKGNFGFGGQYYTIKTILRISRTPFTEVMARKWQKQMFEGMKVHKRPKDGRTDTKKMAKIRVMDLYPNEDFVPTKRSRNMHDGMIDSTLIAEYGRRNFR